jgi:hypothetical protein
MRFLLVLQQLLLLLPALSDGFSIQVQDSWCSQTSPRRTRITAKVTYQRSCHRPTRTQQPRGSSHTTAAASSSAFRCCRHSIIATQRQHQSKQLFLTSSSDDDHDHGASSRANNQRLPLHKRIPLFLWHVSILLLLYTFHMTVLSQHVAILGGYVPVGYDSLAGMAVAIYYFAIFRKRAMTKNNNTQQPPPWRLPSENSKKWQWIRFRLSTVVACAALVRAYFQTGRFSLFWEDLLFAMSAAGWPITIPVSRSLQVLLGHLSMEKVLVQRDTVAEWLRRSTRNRLGLSRTGSSPVGVVTNIYFWFYC